MKIRPMFALYDAWIGFFWDGAKRKLYFFPIPFFGFCIQFKPKPTVPVLHITHVTGTTLVDFSPTLRIGNGPVNSPTKGCADCLECGICQTHAPGQHDPRCRAPAEPRE